MGIGAVKGVGIGDGFAVAEKFGSENNDQMTEDGFSSNHAGGILGGISSGQDIVVRIAVKPTPSIAKVQQTRDIHGNVVEISVKGRHDPCIVPRIIPVAEAMLALVLADCVLESGKYQKH
jgi:chorismate synthase